MQDEAFSKSPLADLAVGIRGIACYVGQSVPIEELSCMANDGALLQRFKTARFKNFSRSTLSLSEQAVLSAQATLLKCGMRAGDIDAVVIGSSELREWHGYPEGLARAVLAGLGMNDIPVAGVTLAGCANVASSLGVARNMVAVDAYRNVLVIETNLLRDDSRRLSGTAPGEMAGNVFGDGAVSFVVTGDVQTADFDLLAIDQMVSIHESTEVTAHEVIAKQAYGKRRVIERALGRAGLTHRQIDCVLMNNMNFMVMLAMLRVLGFSGVDFFTDNIYRYGHVWSADSFINLHDYCEKKAPPAGTRFLMVGHGSGYYSALIFRKRQS